jgi:hypothetical protein
MLTDLTILLGPLYQASCWVTERARAWELFVERWIVLLDSRQ